jgi:response regulator NasT
MTTNPPLKIALAHGMVDAREAIHAALVLSRYEDIWICQTGAELIATTLEHEPDLIITGVDLPDMDGPSALIEISQTLTIPAIVVTRQRSLELVQKSLEDHVMAYLLEPVKPEEIVPTIVLVIGRFEQLKELEAENQSLKQALSDRKVIERAKGFLMKQRDLDEEAAYKQLRRQATDNRIRMVEAAEQVLSGDQPTDE